MTERFTGNETNSHSRTLSDVVSRKIIEIEEVNETDPYKRQGGTPIEMPFTTSESPDGRIEFGKQYETRRLQIGHHEIMYVEGKDPKNRSSQIIVHQFHETGGAAKRLWFKHTFALAEQGLERSGMSKHFQLAPWADMIHHGGYFARKLEDEAAAETLEVLDNPVKHSDKLEDLFALSDLEEKMLAVNQAEFAQSRIEFRVELTAIRRAEREAWRRTDDFIIG